MVSPAFLRSATFPASILVWAWTAGRRGGSKAWFPLRLSPSRIIGIETAAASRYCADGRLADRQSACAILYLRAERFERLRACAVCDGTFVLCGDGGVRLFARRTLTAGCGGVGWLCKPGERLFILPAQRRTARAPRRAACSCLATSSFRVFLTTPQANHIFHSSYLLWDGRVLPACHRTGQTALHLHHRAHTLPQPPPSRAKRTARLFLPHGTAKITVATRGSDTHWRDISSHIRGQACSTSLLFRLSPLHTICKGERRKIPRRIFVSLSSLLTLILDLPVRVLVTISAWLVRHAA